MRPAEMGLVSSAPWQSDPVIVTVKSIIDGGRGNLAKRTVLSTPVNSLFLLLQSFSVL